MFDSFNIQFNIYHTMQSLSGHNIIQVHSSFHCHNLYLVLIKLAPMPRPDWSPATLELTSPPTAHQQTPSLWHSSSLVTS